MVGNETKETPKSAGYSGVQLVAVLDDCTNSQYYTGHGHAHEENLIGCLFSAVPVYSGQTFKNLFEDWLATQRAGEWDAVREDYAEFLNAIPESMIAQSMREGMATIEPLGAVIPRAEEEPEDVFYYCYVHAYGIGDRLG